MTARKGEKQNSGLGNGIEEYDKCMVEITVKSTILTFLLLSVKVVKVISVLHKISKR